MRKVVVTSFMSLDGIMEAPEKWSIPFWNDEIEKFKNEELLASDAQLLGRTTYQTFAEAWPSRSGDYADNLNTSAKYVVSSTLENAQWNNSHILKGGSYLSEEVAQLKKQPGKNILVHGSCSLVHALVQQNLVDQYHLLVYPVLLGAGKRLLPEGVKTNLKLVASQSSSAGVALLTYQPAIA